MDGSHIPCPLNMILKLKKNKNEMVLIQSQVLDIHKYFNWNKVNEIFENEKVIQPITVNEIDEMEENNVQGKNLEDPISLN